MKLLLLMGLALLASGCATLKKPFLYSAEKDNHRIVLLGTIHRGVLSNDLPGIVTTEMTAASTVYFETDFRLYQAVLDARDDPEARKELQRKLLFRNPGDATHPADPKLSQRLPMLTWVDFRKRLTPRYKVKFLNSLNPEGALLLLEQGQGEEVTGFEAYRMSSANGMDFNLFALAKDKKLNTARLDRSDEICQKELEAENVKLIQKYLEGTNENHGLEIFRDMIEAYRNGDEDKVRSLGSSVEEGVEGQCLLEQRNREWLTKLTGPDAPTGPVFVAVGAMHLLTTKFPSLLKLLAEQGYTVKRLSP